MSSRSVKHTKKNSSKVETFTATDPRKSKKESPSWSSQGRQSLACPPSSRPCNWFSRSASILSWKLGVCGCLAKGRSYTDPSRLDQIRVLGRRLELWPCICGKRREHTSWSLQTRESTKEHYKQKATVPIPSVVQVSKEYLEAAWSWNKVSHTQILVPELVHSSRPSVSSFGSLLFLLLEVLCFGINFMVVVPKTVATHHLRNWVWIV